MRSRLTFRVHCAGMTLLELLVAIAILALITTLSYRGIDTLIRSNDRLQADSTRWQALSLFFTRLGNDVSQPSARPVRAIGTATGATAIGNDLILPAWQGLPFPALADDDPGYAAPLEFTRKSVTGRDEIRLAYRLRGNRLELLLWPALDRAAATRPEIHTLLDKVEALHFRYLDENLNWHETWPPTGSMNDSLPRALEVDLRLQDKTHLRRLFALPS